MKTKLFTLFLALLASVGTIFAWDYEQVQIGDLYYNLDETELTAEVVWGVCSGDIAIPSSVAHGAKTYSVTSIGIRAFSYCSDLTSVTIPNSIIRIGSYAFDYCTGLTSITIPNSVTSIGELVFYYCISLPAINVTIDNPNYCSLDGVLFNKDKTILIQFPAGKASASYAIPNSVTSIGSYAFNNCDSLKSVTIPNSVTSIGGRAFSSCDNLKYVNIPNSVINIGYDAFTYCSSLTSLIIGNGVTSIGEYAFSYCAGLTSIEIPNSVTCIERGAFYACEAVTSLTIGKGVTSIGFEAFWYCHSLTSVTCYAPTPPALGNDVWRQQDISAISLYVPVESVDIYKAAKQWKDFGSILPISAKETETTGIQTTSTNNSVDISWPIVTGAASYELVIKDAGGNKICTLVFNANGQLVSLVFHAPARNNAPQQLQETGFVFTVTGLNPGQEYTYTFTATNNSGDVLRTESGSFYTNGTQGIEDVQADNVRSTKIAKDGQILILRGNKTYTLTGQELK